MDHAYASTTVEMDDTGFESLQDQILNNKSQNNEDQDIRSKAHDERSESKSKQQLNAASKKSIFRRGDDQIAEIDDDYEIEIMADKRPTKMTLRELKERASGDIAVKNRMHSLAEEKKRVQATFKTFASMSKTDPLAALEYISNQAREADNEFEYKNYIEKLADQAEKLGQMDEKERKAWELEKKLAKAEQNLSERERTEAIVNRKQELLADYPEVGNEQFNSMVDAVLSNEDLYGDLETEDDVMNKVEELIQETLTQRDIMSVINDINPSYLDDNQLIFSLSDQIRQNPDLDEEDIRDIVREIIGTPQRAPVRQVVSDRDRDVKILSDKARQSTPQSSLRTQNADPFDLLKEQLLERKQEISKTPLYKR